MQVRKRPEKTQAERREELVMGAPKKRRNSAECGDRRASVRVVLRKRPLSIPEIERNELDILACDGTSSIEVNEPRKDVTGAGYTEKHKFDFDQIFNSESTNLTVFKGSLLPLIDSVFNQRSMSTCFAFGQTGSGKTHTMLGPTRMKHRESPQYSAGLWELAAERMFQNMEHRDYNDFTMRISFYEVYCNKVYDLLRNREVVKALEAKGGGVVIKDITWLPVTSASDFVEKVVVGVDQRIVGQNSKNLDSSRGHGILNVEILDVSNALHGKLVFVDLAGSERGADSIFSGKQTQHDGAGINQSLLALKECIRAMDMGNIHIPFRNAELTKILRDSFIVSEARTLMLACVSPSNVNVDQTMNTIRYAARVRGDRRRPVLRATGGMYSDLDDTENASEADRRGEDGPPIIDLQPPPMRPTERLSRGLGHDRVSTMNIDRVGRPGNPSNGRKAPNPRNPAPSQGGLKVAPRKPIPKFASEIEVNKKVPVNRSHEPSPKSAFECAGSSSTDSFLPRPTAGEEAKPFSSRPSLDDDFIVPPSQLRGSMIPEAPPNSVIRRNPLLAHIKSASKTHSAGPAPASPLLKSNYFNASRDGVKLKPKSAVDGIRKVFPSRPDASDTNLSHLGSCEIADLESCEVQLSANLEILFRNLVEAHSDALSYISSSATQQSDILAPLTRHSRNYMDISYVHRLRPFIESNLSTLVGLGQKLVELEKIQASLEYVKELKKSRTNKLEYLDSTEEAFHTPPSRRRAGDGGQSSNYLRDRSTDAAGRRSKSSDRAYESSTLRAMVSKAGGRAKR